MNAINEALVGTNTSLAKLELALNQELTGGKGKLELDFKEAYPLFERHLMRKMRKRTLMDQFNVAYNHQLNLMQFRKLLNAERERRKASGNVAACSGCGQPLIPMADVDNMEGA